MFDTFIASFPPEVTEWLDEHSPGWSRTKLEDDDYYGNRHDNNFLIMDPDQELAFTLTFMIEK